MRKKFNFYGRVQGVGFRYLSNVVAEKYGLYGWVRNNSDGSVTLVIEGLEESIGQMVDYLKKFFQENIDSIEELKEKEEGLTSFDIRHEAR